MNRHYSGEWRLGHGEADRSRENTTLRLVGASLDNDEDGRRVPDDPQFWSMSKSDCDYRSLKREMQLLDAWSVDRALGYIDADTNGCHARIGRLIRCLDDENERVMGAARRGLESIVETIQGRVGESSGRTVAPVGH